MYASSDADCRVTGAVPLAASMAMPSTLIFARFVLEPSRRGRIFFLGSNANSGSPAAGADAAAGSSSAALATTERARSSSPMRRIDLAAGRPPATDGALATVILLAPTATRPTDLTGTGRGPSHHSEHGSSRTLFSTPTSR
jgi:hypothetical protein